MPTRREVFAQALAEGGGRAAVAVVLSKIEALYGESMPRSGVAVTAWHVGARLEGDELVARYVDARALKPTRILADVPESASARFEALLEDDLLPEDLGVAVRAHVRRFFVDAVSNDAIDLSHVIEAQRLCEVLLAAEGLDAAPRRLVEAAVRYFVLSDDGAWDFTANGLDDDLAVLRAVAARVGVVAGAPP
jgi:hypothetical protein